MKFSLGSWVLDHFFVQFVSCVGLLCPIENYYVFVSSFRLYHGLLLSKKITKTKEHEWKCYGYLIMDTHSGATILIKFLILYNKICKTKKKRREESRLVWFTPVVLINLLLTFTDLPLVQQQQQFAVIQQLQPNQSSPHAKWLLSKVYNFLLDGWEKKTPGWMVDKVNVRVGWSVGFWMVFL